MGSGARTPNLCRPHMTARKPTHADRDNSGDDITFENGGLENDDAQELIEYIDRVGSCSLGKLAGWSCLPHAYLKRLLQELEEAGLIDSSQDYCEISITSTASSDLTVATDGGHVPGDGHTDIDIDLNIDLAAADFYKLVSNERRRMVIRILGGVSAIADQADVECSEFVKLGNLVNVIIDADVLAPTGTTDRKRRNSLYNSLAQTHLPLLEDLGLVEYHDRVQKVKPMPLLRQVAEGMDLIDTVAAQHVPRPDQELFETLLSEAQ